MTDVFVQAFDVQHRRPSATPAFGHQDRIAMFFRLMTLDAPALAITTNGDADASAPVHSDFDLREVFLKIQEIIWLLDI